VSTTPSTWATRRFDGIYERVQAWAVRYGSDARTHENCGSTHARGGRGFYFEDPNGHLLEVMTVPETGGERTGVTSRDPAAAPMSNPAPRND
jgi:hypothetical protein